MQIKEYAAKTHQGPHIHINEDSFGFDLDSNCAVIVDAFGGSNIGPIVAKKITEMMMDAYKNIVSDPNATMPFFYFPEYLLETNAIINTCLKVHQDIYTDNAKKNLDQRAGASILVMAKSENIASFICIGNCKAYLYRDRELSQISVNKTFESLTNSRHPVHLRTMPLGPLGLFEHLDYSLNEVRIEKDDQFLLLTDGVYSQVTPPDIIEIIRSNDLLPNDKVENLFELANNRGNKDNQTALLLSY